MKIVCLGDSLTEGYGIERSMSWPGLLGDAMDIPVINSGISGDTTTGMIARFQSSVVEHKPTHVIIMGGTNDVSHGLSEALIISNIRAMTRQAKYHGIQSVIGLPTRIFALENAYDDWTERLFEELMDRIDRYRDSLKAWALEDDQPVIDFAKGLMSSHFLNDGVHPSQSGHALMCENATEVLQAIFPPA